MCDNKVHLQKTLGASILYNCVIYILWCLLADREKKTKLIVHNKHLLLLPGNGTAIERGDGM